MNGILWLFLVVVLFLVLGIVVRNLKKYQTQKKFEARKKKECWGEFTNTNESGIYWDLGRTIRNDNNRSDSRPYLESLGFKFLGYANEMILWVEPPVGWKKESDGFSYWSHIIDQEGRMRFKYFYKNDIINPRDYRAELYPVD